MSTTDPTITLTDGLSWHAPDTTETAARMDWAAVLDDRWAGFVRDAHWPQRVDRLTDSMVNSAIGSMMPPKVVTRQGARKRRATVRRVR